MPAKSQAQQRYFGMLYGKLKKGDLSGLSDKDKETARQLGLKRAKEYAETKHEGLPAKVAAYAYQYGRECEIEKSASGMSTLKSMAGGIGKTVSSGAKRVGKYVKTVSGKEMRQAQTYDAARNIRNSYAKTYGQYVNRAAKDPVYGNRIKALRNYVPSTKDQAARRAALMREAVARAGAGKDIKYRETLVGLDRAKAELKTLKNPGVTVDEAMYARDKARRPFNTAGRIAAGAGGTIAALAAFPGRLLGGAEDVRTIGSFFKRTPPPIKSGISNGKLLLGAAGLGALGVGAASYMENRGYARKKQ